MSQITRIRTALFAGSLPLFFISFSLPLQSRDLDASAAEVGGLFSVFTVVLIALRPLIGRSLDRHGRKWMFVASFSCYVAANLFFANAETIAALYGARILQAVGAAILTLTLDTMTADLFGDQDRSAAMGRNIEIRTRASIVGATIGFTLVSLSPDHAWLYAFGIFAGGAAIGALIALTAVRETAVQRAHADNPQRGSENPLRPLLPVVFSAGFGAALTLPVYLIFLQDRFDLQPAMLAWGFLPGAVVFAVLPSRLAALSERYGASVTLGWAMAVAAAAYAVMPFLQSFWAIVATYTLSAAAWAAADPAEKTLIASRAPAGAMGRAFGTTEVAAASGAAIGPIAGGFVYDAVSPAASLLLASAFLLGGSMLLAGMWPKILYKYT